MTQALSSPGMSTKQSGLFYGGKVMKTSKEKKEEFRQELAEKFSHVLEQKQLDWIKGWNSPAIGSPQNAVTGRNYSGVNRFTLALTSMVNNYTDSRWATMRQIQDHENKYHKDEPWHLKAGSKGVRVEYWYPYDFTKKEGITWQECSTRIAAGREQKEFGVFPKYFTVFNASQIEGIKPQQQIIKNENVKVDSLIDVLSENMNVPIRYDGGRNAFYRPATDDIHLPDPKMFYSSAEFNGTALHELAHASGHPDRLDRIINNVFGDDQYAYEELIAEMTSCFMAINLNDIDISSFNHFENNEAYIQSWMKTIKDKPDLLIQAIKEADRATRYMEWKANIIPEFEYKKTFSFENRFERNGVTEAFSQKKTNDRPRINSSLSFVSSATNTESQSSQSTIVNKSLSSTQSFQQNMKRKSQSFKLKL